MGTGRCGIVGRNTGLAVQAQVKRGLASVRPRGGPQARTDYEIRHLRSLIAPISPKPEMETSQSRADVVDRLNVEALYL